MKPTNEPVETEVLPDERALTTRAATQVAAPMIPEKMAAPAITPAQAKIDAIANLTMAAYQRAATLELTKEESDALQADFPDESFQPGASGKENLIYIEHSALRQRFNQVFGMGKWAIVPRNRWGEPFTIPAQPKYNKPEANGERIYVEAMLIVRGCFVGEAVGAMEYYPKNASQNYGDAVEGAKTAAFRRCAKEFGVGLQAWSKAWCDGWWQRKRAGMKFGPVTASLPQKPEPVQTPQATEKTRDWMIKGLLAGEGQPNREQTTAYFRRIGLLLPSEPIEKLSLVHVPTTKEGLANLAEKIAGLAPEGDDPAEPKPSDDRLSVTGIIQTVTTKEGQSKKGPWTLYGIKINDDWANTFDKKLGELAQANKGSEVTLFYEQGEKGKTALEIQLAGEVTP